VRLDSRSKRGGGPERGRLVLKGAMILGIAKKRNEGYLSQKEDGKREEALRIADYSRKERNKLSLTGWPRLRRGSKAARDSKGLVGEGPTTYRPRPNNERASVVLVSREGWVRLRRNK